MKYLFIIIGVSILFLSGCSHQQQKSKNGLQDEEFDKKKECITYKISLEKDIAKRTQENNTERKSYNEYIEEIFYSKKENSCFAITTIKTDNGNINTTSQRIINLLTTQEYYYDDIYDNNNTGANGYHLNNYNEYISKLKSDL